MIGPPLLPAVPAPDRYVFRSEEEYQRAYAEWQAMEADRIKRVNGIAAVNIVGATVVSLMGVGMISTLLWLLFGWHGPVGLVVVGGLFWAATSRVEQMLNARDAAE